MIILRYFSHLVNITCIKKENVLQYKKIKEVTMFTKIKEFIKSPQFGEVFRFGLNGGICFLVDYAVMILCMKALLFPEWLSIGLGFTVSVILNYILCLVWVFKGATKQSLKSQMIFIGSSIVGLGLTEVLMLFAIHVLKMESTIELGISKVVVTLIVMVWNYFMKRIAIYGTKKTK